MFLLLCVATCPLMRPGYSTAMAHRQLCKTGRRWNREVWEDRHERVTIGCQGRQKGVGEGPVARRGWQHVLEVRQGD